MADVETGLASIDHASRLLATVTRHRVRGGVVFVGGSEIALGRIGKPRCKIIICRLYTCGELSLDHI
jgi:hypothetical protein